MYIAANAYETDPDFPNLCFQASTSTAPSGDVVLRYRRLNSMCAVTPHDVWSNYLDIYGIEGVFPVAATEIGRLAAVASEEILYPEIARALALRGAEVFAHCSSEIGSPNPTHKHIARRARAFENLAYVISANTAGIAGTAMPLASADGNSAVIDWIGRAGARAKGNRPKYFDDPAIDRLLSIVMALAGEVAVFKERLDTVERLLDARGTISRADIEAYVPDHAAGHDRGLMHREFAARILRGAQQEMESLETHESSVEEVSRQLRDS